MARQLRVWLFLAPLFIFLGSCSFVDNSFDPRISAVNSGYDAATNVEILANIARSSRYEPLRFYLHSKFVPSQTSDVKVGLPTITIGPGQIASQKQFLFSSNGLDNSASLSLEVDPIETRDFHNSLMTPQTAGNMGILLANFPRELVFLTLFESVRFQFKGRLPIEYRNVPTPATAECPDFDGLIYDSQSGHENSYYPGNAQSYDDLSGCKYQRFRYWIGAALAYGMSFNFESIPNPKHNANDPKDTQPPMIVSGSVCFDAALAESGLAKATEVFFGKSSCVNTSEKEAAGRKTADANQNLVFSFPYPGPGCGKDGCMTDIELRPRSLLSAYAYLGRLLKMATETAVFVTLHTPEAQANGDTVLFQARSGSQTGSCFTSVTADNIRYCIPGSGADNTYRVFAMMTELTALAQAASDVPNSLSVRLTP